jgi:hypothetical protein
VTRAICPACRSALPLDAVLCGHCGLAVRPTCSNCGEALAADDASCRRCREPIDAPAPAPPVYAPPPPLSTVAIAPRVVPGPPSTATQPARTAARRRRPAFAARLLLIAVVAGALVAGGLLALEAFAPRSQAPFDLVHRSYPALGFSVSRPSAWRETQAENTVTIGQPNGVRGFRVVVEKQTLAAAHMVVSASIRRPPRGVEPIGLSDAVSVDSRPAFRYTFYAGGRYVQQWWIERPGGTFRFEFWSAQNDAGALAEQIVATFALG